MKNNKLKDNPILRKRLRIIGLILTPIGGICLLIGFLDFFSRDMPTMFWMFFLGIFILFPGTVCLQYGYMGKLARYKAGEVAPVAKDTTNYLLDGTREELAKTINATRGLSHTIKCPKCSEENSKDSVFCNHCGHKLSILCRTCGMQNDADSKFCKKCGGGIEL